MVVRVLLLVIGFIVVVNAVLMISGLIFNVNLYKSYGKQIINFFAVFALAIIIVFVILGILGLIK